MSGPKETIPQPSSTSPTLDAFGHLIWAVLAFVYHFVVDCCLYNIWYFFFSTWTMALISIFVIIACVSIWSHYCTLWNNDKYFL
jgi:hypothetical protein